MSLLDIMKVLRDEVVNDKFIATLKNFIEQTEVQTAILFICNTTLAQRQLMTMNPAVMLEADTKKLVKDVARRYDADGIVTVVSCLDIDGQPCMGITIETLLDRHDVLYPYNRTYGAQGCKVSWKEPVMIYRDAIYAELLPMPAGMAQA